MSKEKQIESTDWLTRGMSKEEVEREKQQAIMSTDLEVCHTEFVTGVGDIYTDYDETARKMFEKGWHKQSEGKWTKHLDEWDCEYAKCSCCEAEFYDSNGDDTITIDMFYKFCPECGARMSGGKNE
jgi:hypothetical protein